MGVTSQSDSNARCITRLDQPQLDMATNNSIRPEHAGVTPLCKDQSDARSRTDACASSAVVATVPAGVVGGEVGGRGDGRG